MRYFKKIEGEKIYLSPVNIDDYELYTKWLNNPNITQYLSIHNSLVTLNGEKAFLENNNEWMMAIVKKEDDTLLGNIGLDNIDYKNGNAELGIFIGEEENTGKGYGSEAINLLVNYAFNVLRLHSIYLRTYDINERAQKAYRKCGFKECGKIHEALYRDGKYHDIIYMEVIKGNE